jgi:hypothetical protein
MLPTTQRAVEAVCRADPNLTDREISAAVAVLNGARADEVQLRPPFTRAEVAKLAKVSPRTVSTWLKRGYLQAVRSGRDARRATRYTAESVYALLNGISLEFRGGLNGSRLS